jgi:hypothetical protein
MATVVTNTLKVLLVVGTACLGLWALVAATQAA